MHSGERNYTKVLDGTSFSIILQKIRAYMKSLDMYCNVIKHVFPTGWNIFIIFPSPHFKLIWGNWRSVYSALKGCNFTHTFYLDIHLKLFFHNSKYNVTSLMTCHHVGLRSIRRNKTHKVLIMKTCEKTIWKTRAWRRVTVKDTLRKVCDFV